MVVVAGVVVLDVVVLEVVELGPVVLELVGAAAMVRLDSVGRVSFAVSRPDVQPTTTSRLVIATASRFMIDSRAWCGTLGQFGSALFACEPLSNLGTSSFPGMPRAKASSLPVQG